MSVVPVSVKHLDLIVNWTLIGETNCSLCKGQLIGPSPHDFDKSSKTIVIDSTVLQGKCKHMFHKKCMKAYTDGGNDTCPIDNTSWEVLEIINTGVIYDSRTTVKSE